VRQWPHPIALPAARGQFPTALTSRADLDVTRKLFNLFRFLHQIQREHFRRIRLIHFRLQFRCQFIEPFDLLVNVLIIVFQHLFFRRGQAGGFRRRFLPRWWLRESARDLAHSQASSQARGRSGKEHPGQKRATSPHKAPSCRGHSLSAWLTLHPIPTNAILALRQSLCPVS